MIVALWSIPKFDLLMSRRRRVAGAPKASVIASMTVMNLVSEIETNVVERVMLSHHIRDPSRLIVIHDVQDQAVVRVVA